MKLTVTLKGTSRYSQSRHFPRDKRQNESEDECENRTWKQHAHKNKKGNIVVPTMAVQFMLQDSALYLKEPYKGKQTYTGIFKAGLMVQSDDPLLLINNKPVTDKNLVPEWISANPEGKRKGGSRVPRCYPIFDNWSLTVTVEVIDPRITEKVLLKHLWAAGLYIGLGRFRPANGGGPGRFEVWYKGKFWEPENGLNLEQLEAEEEPELAAA